MQNTIPQAMYKCNALVPKDVILPRMRLALVENILETVFHPSHIFIPQGIELNKVIQQIYSFLQIATIIVNRIYA